MVGHSDIGKVPLVRKGAFLIALDISGSDISVTPVYLRPLRILPAGRMGVVLAISFGFEMFYLAIVPKPPFILFYREGIDLEEEL